MRHLELERDKVQRRKFHYMMIASSELCHKKTVNLPHNSRYVYCNSQHQVEDDCSHVCRKMNKKLSLLQAKFFMVNFLMSN